MEKIKELWANLVAWIQANIMIAAGIGAGILVVVVWLFKRSKRKARQRRSARKARLAKKKKRRRK